MTRKSHYADVVTEVLATELGANTHVLCHLVYLGFHLNVSECAARFVAWKGRVSRAAYTEYSMHSKVSRAAYMEYRHRAAYSMQSRE